MTFRGGFLGEPGSQLFTVNFEPSTPARGHIVYLAPFGEEMNRTRSLAAEQARRFAALGYRCTVLDLSGTGDSDGELHDVSLARWRDDIDRTVASCGDLPCLLWGARLGALLALDCAARQPGRYPRLLLWQPVTSGKRFITQLLRLRVAALASRDLPAETTAQIREQLAGGAQVDVAGYALGGQLVADLEGLDVSRLGPLGDVAVDWFEYLPEAGAEAPVGVRKALDALRQGGARVELHPFGSPPVWQLQKRFHSRQLVEASVGVLA